MYFLLSQIQKAFQKKRILVIYFIISGIRIQ